MTIEIFNINTLPHTELTSKATGEKFSLSAIISGIYSFNDIFVTHEIIPVGRKSSSPHSHSQKEEIIIVLFGNPTVYLGEDKAQLNPGDFIGFKPSTDMHYLENNTDTEVQILVISSNPQNDVINYPK